MKNCENATAKLNGWFWGALVIIAIAAMVFRFWGLGTDELAFDEGIYAFRSIGYLDYLENPDQVTPIQTFQNREAPTWVHLSFHDHPPLFFAVGHLFFNIFGESLLVARLPSALEGFGSLVLIFLITQLLFGKFESERLRAWKDWAGLFAAAIMAVSFASVAVSRLDQLEALLFLAILANIYTFLRFIDDKRWWWVFSISFGLCLLTKYTAVFLIPAYFAYLLLIRSPLLKDWCWYAGWGIAGVLFLPVIIYNIKLYNLLGHFDLQFAYLFGQATPEWHGIGGKNQEPFRNIFANIGIIYSIPFLILTVAGLAVSVAKKSLGKIRWFPVLLFVFILALLAVVGSAIRFISLLIIPAAFFIAISTLAVGKRWKPFLAVALAAIFFLHEGFFTFNFAFLHRADYGIIKLDRYFDSEFKNARPAGLLTHPNPNLNKIIEQYAKSRPATLPSVGIVYDDEISTPARLWLFSRRQYYHGIPVMPASGFLEKVKSSGGQAFKGFQFYFVKAEPATTISPVHDAAYKQSFETFWNKISMESKFTIKNSAGAPAFEVSRFSLD